MRIIGVLVFISKKICAIFFIGYSNLPSHLTRKSMEGEAGAHLMQTEIMELSSQSITFF